MVYNYGEDTFTCGKGLYSLKDYRRFLLMEYPDLCQNFFIKAIRSGGKTVFTYDWHSIYSTARNYRYHIQFIKTIKQNERDLKITADFSAKRKASQEK